MDCSMVEDDWVNIDDTEMALPTRSRRPGTSKIISTAARSIPRIDRTPFYQSMRERGERIVYQQPAVQIFHLDLPSRVVEKTFRLALPTPGLQQEFHCSACRKVINKVGDLAFIDRMTGTPIPLFWDSKTAPADLILGVEAVEKLIAHSKASNPFFVNTLRGWTLADDMISIGDHDTGGYPHMFIDFPAYEFYKPLTRAQIMYAPAPVTELAFMLLRITNDYNTCTINTAAQMILRDDLPYAANHKSAIRWLLDIISPKGVLDPVLNNPNPSLSLLQIHNLYILAASTSFTGCINSLRNGVLNELLLSLHSNKSPTEIRKHWIYLTDPGSYLRPTSAPTHGALVNAEKLFSDLGITEQDLRRRFVTEQDIPDAAWLYRKRTQSPDPTATTPSIFSHISPKPTPPLHTTFINFLLHYATAPSVKSISYHLPSPTSIYHLTTSALASPPLLKWPNNTSAYTRLHPSAPELTTSLSSGWTPVLGILPFPNLWPHLPAFATFPLPSSTPPDYGAGVRYLIALDGCRETQRESVGLCLFPSILDGRFHGVRKTVEAYSRSRVVEDADTDAGAAVGGVAVERGEDNGKWEHRFKITTVRGEVREFVVVGFE